MLTRTSLTIRLHPNDDVVIARTQLVGGTLLADENVTVAGLVPPGHKVATRAIRAGEPVKRYNQIIGFASRDIAPGEHVHLNNLAMGAFDRDYAFGADAKPTQYVDAAGDVHGHRPRRRPRRDAQLHRHPVDGQLLGDRRARHRRPFPRRARSRRFRNVDGVVALTHGSGCGMDTHGDGMQLLRRTLGGYARHANFAGVLIVGLGCEANQISSLLGAREPAGGPAAAHVQHPGHRRHGEDDRARRRASSSEMLPHANDVDAAAGAGVAHHRRPAVRRLRRLLGHHRQSGARRGGRPAGAPRRHGDPVRDARDLRRRAPADAPRGVARGRREARRAHQVVGGLHGAREGRDEQQPVAGQQGGRPDDDPREVAGRGRQGRHDEPRRRLRVRRAGDGEGLRLHGHAGLRPGVGDRAGGGRREHDRVHDGPRLGVRLRAVAVAQAVDQHARCGSKQEEDIDLNCGEIADGTATVDEIGERLFQLMLDTASGAKTQERAARLRPERVRAVVPGRGDVTARPRLTPRRPALTLRAGSDDSGGNVRATQRRSTGGVASKLFCKLGLALVRGDGIRRCRRQAAAQEKLTVWWVKGFYKSEDDALFAAIKKFEDKTGVKVELSQYPVQDMIPKTVAALDAGTPPDVAYADVYDFQVTGKWAYDGKLEDISDILAPIKDKFLKNTIETTYLYNDKTKKKAYYAFPLKQQTMHIQYWKDMLGEAGYKDSDIPTAGRPTGTSGATRCSRRTARRPASAPMRSASRWAWIRATRSTRS